MKEAATRGSVRKPEPGARPSSPPPARKPCRAWGHELAARIMLGEITIEDVPEIRQSFVMSRVRHFGGPGDPVEIIVRLMQREANRS